ncbi:MAG: MogA/MoaB family molybdenum cofactor biosynthesis protein [Clostridia bacterium]
MQAAVVTVSDKGFSGEREDTAGPLVAKLLSVADYAVIGVTIVPDEQERIEEELIRLADECHVPLIVTTGGTGFSLRDITPEATCSVCMRMVPGIPEAMRAACLPITPRAMLSRGVAGIRGRSLIINLPGSPKAAKENLVPVLPALEHGLQMLLGAMNECATE